METVIIGKHQLVFCQLTQLPRGLNFCLQSVPLSHPFPFSSLLLRDKSSFPIDHRVLVVFVAAAVGRHQQQWTQIIPYANVPAQLHSNALGAPYGLLCLS